MILKIEKTKTTVGRLKCPKCGYLNWAVLVDENKNSSQCNKCGEWSPSDEYKIVEIEVDAYKCPNCGSIVADSEENYNICTWGGPEPTIICSECQTIIHGFIHHENHETKIDVEVRESGGYFNVYHKNCPKAEIGYMELKRLCVDTEMGGSRVVLVYVCRECGAQQVIKDHLDDTKIWNASTKRWWRK
jgi:ribosomal protein S27AE